MQTAPKDPTKHCLAFVRLIQDLEDNLDHPMAWRFIDLDQNGRIDSEVQHRLDQLRDEKLLTFLKSMNLHRW